MASGQRAWEHRVDCGELVVRPHFTTIERRKKSGYFFSYFAPRMDIDILKPPLKEPVGYVPNLDPGDLVRIVEVLEHVTQGSVVRKFREGDIEPFEVSLTFKRRLVVKAARRPGLVRVEYFDYDRNTSREKLRFRVLLPAKSLAELVRALRSLVAIYVALINVWRKGQKVPPPWIVTQKVK